ncbi:MAG TPA: M1 family metallopeptidase [Patescibacteria group bacterium]|nr:M1 family metallopeptidase [Patescibacteria group bacterium]
MNYRLPLHIKPSIYKIRLRPNFSDFTFTGEEIITISVLEETKDIILHSADLTITKAVLEDTTGKHTATISFDKEQEHVIFTFPQKISVGEKELHIEFNGILSDRMRGFYRSKYYVEGEEFYLATSQLEETDARRVFPSFDEPSHKAVFEITLEIPKDHQAISNTIPVEIIEEEEIQIVRFSPTPKMSTYLVALIVGRFDVLEKKTKDDVLVRVFVTPGKKHQAEFALEVGVKMLEFYTDYFGIAYPLPVLDLIAVADFDAGAMENWGAITFRETALLIDPEHSASVNRERVAIVIAHELAHMWFGNLVTMEWWTYLWLNEGFAAYMEYLATDAVFPEWKMWEQFIAVDHNSALGLDGLKNTHAIEIDIHHPREITEIFDAVSYAKGASVIHMLATYLGADIFRKGLQLYLNKHAYGNATSEDLWNAFSKVSGQDIASLMNGWTRQPGYPVIAATKKENKLTLSQKRFFASRLSREEEKEKPLWQIPLVNSMNGTLDEFILQKEQETFDSKADWIKLNTQEAAFVRVSYDEKMIEALQKALSEGKLSTIDRLGIIRDIFDLAFAQEASITTALDMAKSYDTETEYVVWLELVGQLDKLYGLIGEDIKLQETLARYARELLSKIALRVSWEPQKGESHNASLLRMVILSQLGKFGDKKTITTAQEYFAKFFADKTPINPEIRGIVYTIVARNGGQKEFDTFVAMYRKEDLHQEKDRIAKALTSFTSPQIISQVLEWTISEDVRLQDCSRFIAVLFLSPGARAATWEFIKSHWVTLEKQLRGTHGLGRLIDLAGEMTSEKQAQDVEAFFKKHPTPQLTRSIQQVIESILQRSDFLSSQRKHIDSYFS